MIDQQIIIIVLIVETETPIIPQLRFAIAAHPLDESTPVINLDIIAETIMT